jgi:hypothetical protein
MTIRFEDQIAAMIWQLRKTIDMSPINFGGTTGSGGGTEGRPGGYIGQLTQDRITYDLSEIASSGVPASGLSLVDNLNHIRYDISQLEPLTINRNGVPIASGVTVLDFSHEFDVTPSGSDQANIEIGTVDDLQFNVLPSGVEEVGGKVYWNGTEYTLNVVTGLGPVLQLGQEIYLLVYNDTAEEMTNLSVLRPRTATVISGEVIPVVEKALGDRFDRAEGTLMVATMDIPPSGIGLATRFGRARGGDTSGFTPGDGLFLSATASGELVDTRPAFPNYNISIGGVLVSDPEEGEIFVSITRDIFDTTLNFWNGSFRESIDFLVTSDGATVTGSLSPQNGHPDMTMMFSDGLSVLDTSPAATITLTPGTDTNPQMNYVYVLKSTKVLTVSTSDWPTTEHIKVATVFLQSAATTAVNDALRNQNWNDHIQATDNDMGHMLHITEKLRQFEAQWLTGIEVSVTIDTVPSPDAVYISTTAGKVFQLHRQIFPALDMETGDDIHIVNDFTVPYKTLTDLSDQTTLSDGSAIPNSKYFSIVIWGVQNKTGETCHLMCNMPSGTYNSGDSAVSDALNYSVYEVPNDFQGVGFLIARVTFQNTSGNWAHYDTEDLRGKIPNVTAGGGGGGGGGSTTFLGLTDTPSAYTGEAGKLAVISAGESALEFGTTITNGFVVDGSADEIQLTLQANSTQTANILEIQDSSANVLSGADERGILFSDGGIDVGSVYLGSGAGSSSATGVNNIGIGEDVLSSVTTGHSNVVVGGNSLTALTEGLSIVAVGYRTLATNVDGRYLVAIGSEAMRYYDGTGNAHSVAIGRWALSGSNSNRLTGVENVAVGSQAGRYQAGRNNVFIGESSGLGVDGSSTGFRNTAIGSDSGLSLTTGNYNIFLGHQSGSKQTTLSNLFIVDYLARADIATELTNSILYGVMAATPASQTLRINAVTTLGDGSTLLTSAAPTSDAQIANKKYVDDTAGGSSTFVGLTDTPASYAGEALSLVHVNAGTTALEFISEFTVNTQFLGSTFGGALAHEVSSKTNPTILPAVGDPDTGIATDLADELYLITGGTSRISIVSGDVGIGTPTPAYELDVNGAIGMLEKNSDPSDPAEGSSVMWMSDGTGEGDNGDLLVKITAGGVTKTITLVDFSEA